MDNFGHHSDEGYRNSHRAAEEAYLAAGADFSGALTREIGKLSRAADADKTDAPMYLIEQLAQMCRVYVASELSAYGGFLVRKGIPHSRGANDLEEYARRLLDNVHRRKWNYEIKKISELFECESSEKMWWKSVEDFAEAYLREIAEPQLLTSDFTPSAQVMEPSNTGEALKDSSEPLAVSNGAPGSAGSAMTFWQSLRLGFTQLRADCAIDPPLKPAGRLTAIWTTPPEPGKWRLDHWDRKDGAGVARRFEWHAQSAAAQLGFRGSGDAAVFFWLDRIKEDAPEVYVRKFTSTDDAGVDRVCMVEIYDICGLSAEYCVKCQASEIRSKPASAETGAGNSRIAEMQGTGGSGAISGSIDVGAIDPFQEDASARPLGDNPFPQEHPTHAAFEEATWKAKRKIGKFKKEFLTTKFVTARDFVQSALTYRKRWFTTCAFEATLIVGNEATADWYEHWIDDFARFLLEDTLSGLRRKDPKAHPTAAPFFSPEDLEYVENDLTRELMIMVAHYKAVAADRAVEVIARRNAAQAAAAAESVAATSEGELGPEKVKSALGRNIDRLRKECGWSFDDLAKATELDKKLILGHVNDGRGAHPKTLEAYARTFTEKMGRPITVAELES